MPDYFDYLNIKPITGPIPPKKQEAKRHYGVHPYFTRRSYNVVQAYIKNFTQEGDLVVDPFGGSGVTAIEALVLRRRAIHIDINPLANFITKCVAVAPVDIDELTAEFKRIEAETKPYLDFIASLTNTEAAKEPIKDWYPKNVKLPSNADTDYVEDLFSPKQLRTLAHIRAKIVGIENVLYRDLLLYVFSSVVQKCNLTVSQTLKGTSAKGGAISAILKVARYWLPPKPVELDPWKEFESKFKLFIKSKNEVNQEINSFYNDSSLRILKADAANLVKTIDSESADYIYTDPPYGAHIAYLDLSTMWNAWLGFDVTEADKIAEVIEDGDLNKTKEDYTERLRKSIQEMFRILKYDRWFSLVFAHKDPLYWDTIIKSAEECGFEYVNTSVVKAGIVSYHKHKNPLRVLSGEMVINFLKKKKPRALAVTQVGVDVVQFVLNSAELSIVTRDGGATTDQIHEDLIPKLIETGLLADLRDKISDITPLLGDKFIFRADTARWVIPPNTKLGSFIPLEFRIRFYIESFLNSCERLGISATLEMIWADVIPKLKNGAQPAEQELSIELERIAEPYSGQYYKLKQIAQQELFDRSTMSRIKLGSSNLPVWEVGLPDEIEHDEIIYRLALLCKASGLLSYIGKNERLKGDYSDKLKQLSINNLPKVKGLSAFSRKKVEQIDLIWFDDIGFPAYAFEIEKSTAITTAIERFIELLKVSLSVGGKAIIICPSTRKNKLDEVLSQSHFIGAPMYMENKLKYLYFSDVVDLYNTCQEGSISLEILAVELRKRLHAPLQ